MIINFKDKDTEVIFNGGFSKKFPRDIQKRAFLKLTKISEANFLEDLKSPPSNNLESLKGTRKGQYSIRINNQWRICFRFENAKVFDVEIVDYH
jgi:proteic killer suppression protein